MPANSMLEIIRALPGDIIHQKISLAGRLTDVQGKQSISGAMVTLRIASKCLRSRTQNDGSFHFENLADGNYALFVSKKFRGRKFEIAFELTSFKEIDGYIKPFKTKTYKKDLSLSWLSDKSMHVLDFEFKDNMVKILNNG